MKKEDHPPPKPAPRTSVEEPLPRLRSHGVVHRDTPDHQDLFPDPKPGDGWP